MFGSDWLFGELVWVCYVVLELLCVGIFDIWIIFIVFVIIDKILSVCEFVLLEMCMIGYDVIVIGVGYNGLIVVVLL